MKRRLGPLVFLAAAAYFALGVVSEPFFADESASFAQTYYARLLARGDVDHIDWLHPAAYDQLLFPKLVMGTGLAVSGQRGKVPTSLEPWEWWMAGHFDPPSERGVLWGMRIPMLLAAAFGCWGAFELCKILVGEMTGLAAALFLAASPLYAMHARRAMADDLVQALVLWALVAVVAACERLDQKKAASSAFLAMLAGIAGGLATGSKLNGGVAPISAAIFLGPVAMIALGMRRAMLAAKLLLLFGISGSAAAGTFVLSQPYLWTKATPMEKPSTAGFVQVNGRRMRSEAAADLKRQSKLGVFGRIENLWRHRTLGLHEAVDRFPNDALRSPTERMSAICWEGLGRWSAAGRLPLPRDASSTLASVVVVLGFAAAAGAGRTRLRAGHIPAVWVLIVWIVVEGGSLLGNLTLNWDRYYLGFVTAASVLAAYGLGASAVAIREKMILRPPTLEPTP